MKRISITLLYFFLQLIAFSSQASGPGWQWAHQASGDNFDRSNAITTDGSGNVYVTGQFNGIQVTFGTITLTNNFPGDNDVFIVKYDSTGNVLWANSFGGNNDDRGKAVATDAAGNVYLTGHFESDTMILGSTQLFTQGLGDLFVIKYDANGSILWAKSAGGNSQDFPYDIAVDQGSNCYIAGRFSSSSLTLGANTFIQQGNIDLFIVKYDAAGNVAWSKAEGGGGADEAFGIEVDHAGNIFVAGEFISSITIGTTTLTSAGTSDIFIAKYNPSGTVAWAKSAGGISSDNCSSLALDQLANAYITGSYSSPSITFGPSVLPNAAAYFNFYVAKYDSSGNAIWGRSAQSDLSNGNSIAVSYDGIVYTAGDYNGDSLVFNTTTLINASTSDLFVAAYDLAGNELWVQSHTAGGLGEDYALGITSSVTNQITICGVFDDILTLGTATINPPNGHFDGFIARIGNGTNDIGELNESQLSLYPNPSSGYIFLKGMKNKFSLIIYSPLGEKVIERKNCHPENPVDVTILPSGIYFIHVITDEKEISFKAALNWN
jgi:hypothetical protein